MTGEIIISIFDSIPLWVMILPILFCSIVAMAVVIERLICYKKINLDYRLLMSRVVDIVKSNKIDEAKSLCSRYSGPLITMINSTLLSWNDIKDKELLIRDGAEKSIRDVEKFGGVISTIATISPMLGLLGTVTGMMKSFSGLSAMGPSARDLLAQGITEALITTALGLLVAIPSVMFYNYMVSKIDFFVREVEYIANSFIELE